MELERPHRPAAPSTTSDLSICFSSMRLSSKSMVSPGRADKPPISLSASLSRRLRSKNGSLKGGQSPMFPPGMSSKKRGGCGAIDSSNNNNPEPSSPKVTCIGQVRVKTKKHGKKMKMNMSRAYRARRSGSSGDLRGEGDGCLQHNQRWVHLPVAICGALRGFGSDFNCFSPCKPSCFSGSEGEGRRRGSKSNSCCGSLCRWLVASHEGEGKRRDIELVVGEEEDRGVERVMETLERECSRRRSIFDDVDFNIDEICEAGNEIGGEGEGGEEEEAAARVSICVPPKNALLLMRCRSDPVKMSALSSRFWESPPKNQPRGNEEEEDRAVEETGRRRSSVSERVKVESLSSFAEEETGRRRSSVSERVKVESSSSFAEEETGRRRSSVSERVKVESLSNYEEETGRRSSVSERVKVESLSRNAEEETGRRRSSVSERVKVESLSSNAEEETGRRRSSVSERVKVESLSRNAEEETGRRRSSVSERVKAESLSSYAEEEAGRRRSSVSERLRVESLSIYAEETGRRRSSFSERVKLEPLSSYSEETGRRRSSASERVNVESLSSYAEETGRRRSSVSERVKIESLSSSAEEELQLEVESEDHQQGVGAEMDGGLIQEEKLQKQRFSIDSKDQVKDLVPLKEDKEENYIEIQQTVGDKVSSFEKFEEDIQPQPLKEDELTALETEEKSEQQPLEEASEDDDSMEEEGSMQEREEEESGLPDCLLLMMCEPKVSMEVSKETWVCSTDFIRWLPERHRQHHLKKINPTNGGDAAATTTKKKKKNRTTTTESNPPPPARLPEARLPPQPQGFQPPRSSCSFPIGGGVSTAGVVKEKKLVNAVAYEPFVLTRCKSEPMRSATAKLAPAPELTCFWKNRKIEPHRPAACGVGAAGLGC